VPLACGGPDAVENMKWHGHGGQGEGSLGAPGLPLGFSVSARLLLLEATGQMPLITQADPN
jgi:hypothetical protein